MSDVTFIGVWKVENSSYNVFDKSLEGKVKLSISYEHIRTVISELFIEKTYLIMILQLYDGFYADKSKYIMARNEFQKNNSYFNFDNSNFDLKDLVGTEINKHFIDYLSFKSKDYYK